MYVQQISQEVPSKDACTRYAKAEGPFSSCVYMISTNIPIFDGACANSAFNNGAKKYSFRIPFVASNLRSFQTTTGEEGVLPDFIDADLEKASPGHRLLRQAKAACWF